MILGHCPKAQLAPINLIYDPPYSSCDYCLSKINRAATFPSHNNFVAFVSRFGCCTLRTPWTAHNIISIRSVNLECRSLIGDIPGLDTIVVITGNNRRYTMGRSI